MIIALRIQKNVFLIKTISLVECAIALTLTRWKLNKSGSLAKSSGQNSTLLIFAMLNTMLKATIMCMALAGVAGFLPGFNLMDSQSLKKVNFPTIFFMLGAVCIGSVGGKVGVSLWLSHMVPPPLLKVPLSSLPPHSAMQLVRCVTLS